MFEIEKIWELLISLDREIIEVLFLSLKVSGTSVLIGMLLGIPIGSVLALSFSKNRWIRNLILLIKNLTFTFMGFPPVLAGLIVYLFLSASGPLGSIQMLFTPSAMVIAQTILVTPIISGLTYTAIDNVDKLAVQNAVSLGATPLQKTLLIIGEARKGIIAGVVTGFGRAIAEVGAVMLVGGNIKHHTRVLTTAIVLETRQGEFERAIALGIILVTIAFLVNTLLLYWQKGGSLKWRR